MAIGFERKRCPVAEPSGQNLRKTSLGLKVYEGKQIHELAHLSFWYK